MTHQKKSGQSPYQRYGKVPYRYSELYQQWRRARLDGREGDARRLGQMHTDRFMPKAAPDAALAA